MSELIAKKNHLKSEWLNKNFTTPRLSQRKQSW